VQGSSRQNGGAFAALVKPELMAARAQVVWGDLQQFSIRYLQLCEGYRTDVSVVDLAMASYPWCARPPLRWRGILARTPLPVTSSQQNSRRSCCCRYVPRQRSNVPRVVYPEDVYHPMRDASFNLEV